MCLSIAQRSLLHARPRPVKVSAATFERLEEQMLRIFVQGSCLQATIKCAGLARLTDTLALTMGYCTRRSARPTKSYHPQIGVQISSDVSVRLKIALRKRLKKGSDSSRARFFFLSLDWCRHVFVHRLLAATSRRSAHQGRLLVFIWSVPAKKFIQHHHHFCLDLSRPLLNPPFSLTHHRLEITLVCVKWKRTWCVTTWCVSTRACVAAHKASIQLKNWRLMSTM